MSRIARNLWSACPTLPNIPIPFDGITIESEEVVKERLQELRRSNQRYYARKIPAIKKKEDTWNIWHIKCDWQTFSTFLNNQRYACACCGLAIDEASAYVDYNVNTGAVRGLLCNYCDLMLIGACDSVDRLISGILYKRSFFNAVTEPNLRAIGRDTTNGYM